MVKKNVDSSILSQFFSVLFVAVYIVVRFSKNVDSYSWVDVLIVK